MFPFLLPPPCFNAFREKLDPSSTNWLLLVCLGNDLQQWI